MSTITTKPVLSDLFPRTKVRDVALILGGTALLALTSQVLIPLGFTPVPLSLATFAVILIGASLGPLRASASTGLFVLLGVAGVPVFAGFTSGTATASFGYACGYVLAAIAAGFLARHQADRKVASTFLMAAICSTLIYALGVPWLMFSAHLNLQEGLMLGVVPFLVGDLIKAIGASALLPGVWKIIRRK